MPRPRPTTPPYRHHTGRGLAFTIVAGRTVYLGKWNSPASKEKHARLVAEAASGRAVAVRPDVDPAALTVAGLLAAFWSHAKTVYPFDPAHEGRRPAGELGSFHDVMRPVLKLYAGTPAAEFGPRALQLVQAEMVTMGWCRNVVNRSTVRIRTMFKWAVGAELLPGEVHHRLTAVSGLRRGQGGVRDTAKVKPVPADVLAATLAACPPRLRAMIELQALTGMRSGELCQMRAGDVERPADGGPWVYRPRTHKTMHHGHELAVRIGPRAQATLAPYLKPDRPEAFVFSPAENMAEVRAARAAARKTPATCGNAPGTNVKRSPRKVAGNHYSPHSYAQAVNRACDRADLAARRAAAVDAATVPEDLPDDERLVPRWHPHQLRHNRATAVRASHGLDGVQAALGQRTVSVAERYAEVDATKADRIAAELG